VLDLLNGTPLALQAILLPAVKLSSTLAAIQKILGHDRLGTTVIYLNLTDAHIVEEYTQKW
jgi:integrase/recombinase XerD